MAMQKYFHRDLEQIHRRLLALSAIVEQMIDKASRADVDYVELRDPDSLEPAPARLEGPALLALAVFFRTGEEAKGARVRLIDNRLLRPQPESEEGP